MYVSISAVPEVQLPAPSSVSKNSTFSPFTDHPPTHWALIYIVAMCTLIPYTCTLNDGDLVLRQYLSIFGSKISARYVAMAAILDFAPLSAPGEI